MRYLGTLKVERSHLSKTFATVSPFIGAVLLAIRGSEADAVEKFLYVTMTGPLVLLAIATRYFDEKKNILAEPVSTNRQTLLSQKQVEFRKLLTIVLVASCALVGVTAWLLFFSVKD